MNTKQTANRNDTRRDVERTRFAEWQLHRLDELYRLAGLAPLHAYQAAQADLQSLHGDEHEEGKTP